MSDIMGVRTGAEGERTLAVLNVQAEEARSELIELKGQLARARSASDGDKVRVLREANEKLLIAALRAQEAAQTASEELDHLAQTSQRDVLTGSPNRQLLHDCLAAAIRVAGRSKTCLATLFVDLDQFKAINDLLGHAGGDGALRIVARRLQLAVRQTDTVGRYGGDEFLILLSPIAQPADAAIIAKKINASLSEPITVGGQSMSTSASIGIALYPQDGLDALTLIDRADQAMYRAKRDGPGGFAFHSYGSEAEASGDVAPAPPRVAAVAGDDQRALIPKDLVDANERLVVSAMAAQQAGGHAEEARLRQIRFMAMVAHEMRDPLAPIRNAAEMLFRVDSEDRMLIAARDIIRRQVDHMSRLVEDLIDGSRASAGKFALRVGPVDIVAMLRLATDACRQQTGAQTQSLTLVAPDNLPFHGDPVRLMQIFMNLLENASKYTPAGGAIMVTAAQDGKSIVVTIADNGNGIAQDTLPHIFDLFVQEPGDRARRNGGLGIGLAVVRDLVEAHGGTVTAESDGVDRGSRFVVTLPMDREDPGA